MPSDNFKSRRQTFRRHSQKPYSKQQNFASNIKDKLLSFVPTLFKTQGEADIEIDDISEAEDIHNYLSEDEEEKFGTHINGYLKNFSNEPNFSENSFNEYKDATETTTFNQRSFVPKLNLKSFQIKKAQVEESSSDDDISFVSNPNNNFQSSTKQSNTSKNNIIKNAENITTFRNLSSIQDKPYSLNQTNMISGSLNDTAKKIINMLGKINDSQEHKASSAIVPSLLLKTEQVLEDSQTIFTTQTDITPSSSKLSISYTNSPLFFKPSTSSKFLFKPTTTFDSPKTFFSMGNSENLSFSSRPLPLIQTFDKNIQLRSKLGPPIINYSTSGKISTSILTPFKSRRNMSASFYRPNTKSFYDPSRAAFPSSSAIIKTEQRHDDYFHEEIDSKSWRSLIPKTEFDKDLPDFTFSNVSAEVPKLLIRRKDGQSLQSHLKTAIKSPHLHHKPYDKTLAHYHQTYGSSTPLTAPDMHYFTAPKSQSNLALINSHSLMKEGSCIDVLDKSRHGSGGTPSTSSVTTKDSNKWECPDCWVKNLLTVRKCICCGGSHNPNFKDQFVYPTITTVDTPSTPDILPVYRQEIFQDIQICPLCSQRNKPLATRCNICHMSLLTRSSASSGFTGGPTITTTKLSVSSFAATTNALIIDVNIPSSTQTSFSLSSMTSSPFNINQLYTSSQIISVPFCFPMITSYSTVTTSVSFNFTPSPTTLDKSDGVITAPSNIAGFSTTSLSFNFGGSFTSVPLPISSTLPSQYNFAVPPLNEIKSSNAPAISFPIVFSSTGSDLFKLNAIPSNPQGFAAPTIATVVNTSSEKFSFSTLPTFTSSVLFPQNSMNQFSNAFNFGIPSFTSSSQPTFGIPSVIASTLGQTTSSLPGFSFSAPVMNTTTSMTSGGFLTNFSNNLENNDSGGGAFASNKKMVTFSLPSSSSSNATNAFNSTLFNAPITSTALAPPKSQLFAFNASTASGFFGSGNNDIKAGGTFTFGGTTTSSNLFPGLSSASSTKADGFSTTSTAVSLPPFGGGFQSSSSNAFKFGQVSTATTTTSLSIDNPSTGLFGSSFTPTSSTPNTLKRSMDNADSNNAARPAPFAFKQQQQQPFASFDASKPFSAFGGATNSSSLFSTGPPSLNQSSNAVVSNSAAANKSIQFGNSFSSLPTTTATPFSTGGNGGPKFAFGSFTATSTTSANITQSPLLVGVSGISSSFFQGQSLLPPPSSQIPAAVATGFTFGSSNANNNLFKPAAPSSSSSSTGFNFAPSFNFGGASSTTSTSLNMFAASTKPLFSFGAATTTAATVSQSLFPTAASSSNLFGGGLHSGVGTPFMFGGQQQQPIIQVSTGGSGAIGGFNFGQNPMTNQMASQPTGFSFGGNLAGVGAGSNNNATLFANNNLFPSATPSTTPMFNFNAAPGIGPPSIIPFSASAPINGTENTENPQGLFTLGSSNAMGRKIRKPIRRLK